MHPSLFRRYATRVTVLAAVAVLGAACAADSTSTISTPADLTTASVTESKILDVSSPLVGGSSLNASSYIGKPVAFWFWAPG
ncbi:unannotated protein [freshwater metagenome]|uniref:Unannotated protein n=1 Tax=freshwater metagenome TaxID=449393 RepID=A0A6J7FJH1_9ZZZZ|nr:hypothetical protein [Actinomycetota bacterium]